MDTTQKDQSLSTMTECLGLADNIPPLRNNHQTNSSQKNCNLLRKMRLIINYEQNKSNKVSNSSPRELVLVSTH